MATLTCALGPDSAGTVVGSRLRRVQRTLDAAMYEVGPSYAWMLVRAARRGVRVRVVLDRHASDGNRETADALATAGAGCRVAGSGESSFHPKVLLLDGATLAVGTGNLLWRDAPRHPGGKLPPGAPPLRGTREWWLLADGARHLNRVAARELESAWQVASSPPRSWELAPPEPEAAAVGTPLPQVPPVTVHVADRRLRLVFSAREVHAAQLDLLAGARHRALVTVPYAHTGCAPVRAFLEALCTAATRGADTGLLLGRRPAPEDRRRLQSSGVIVRAMDPTRSTRGHAKGVVVDDIVMVSSANWSVKGQTVNWEAALIVQDRRAAEYFASAWNRDWSSAVAV